MVENNNTNIKRISLDSFKLLCNKKSLDNAQYKIELDGIRQIDMQVKGFGDSSKNMLVVFSGAVTNRETKTGPFFSGIGLSETLNMPLISFSDPVVTKSKTCGIGWYTGGKDFPDFPRTIAEIVDLISETMGKRAILLGGSAGGYACLVQSTLLKSKNTIVVWNPQTEINKYVKKNVDEYQVEVYGDISERLIGENLLTKEPLKNSTIIYLQNKSDWHTEAHATPYKLAHNVDIQKENRLINKSGNIMVYEMEWGFGHVPYPTESLRAIIRAIDNNKDFCEVIRGQGVYFTSADRLDLTLVDESLIANKKVVQISVAYPGEVQYAFYYIVDGKKYTKWYSQDNEVEFAREIGVEQMVIFIKNRGGDIITKTINIEPFNEKVCS